MPLTPIGQDCTGLTLVIWVLRVNQSDYSFVVGHSQVRFECPIIASNSIIILQSPCLKTECAFSGIPTSSSKTTFLCTMALRKVLSKHISYMWFWKSHNQQPVNNQPKCLLLDPNPLWDPKPTLCKAHLCILCLFENHIFNILESQPTLFENYICV